MDRITKIEQVRRANSKFWSTTKIALFGPRCPFLIGQIFANRSSLLGGSCGHAQSRETLLTKLVQALNKHILTPTDETDGDWIL